MGSLKIIPKLALQGEIDCIATDKSISHRCAIFALLSDRPSIVRGYLQAEDTLNTLKIACMLGLKVDKKQQEWIFTPPKNGIQEPDNLLDCGNAGTAIRLYCGLLSGVKGYFVLGGDSYLRVRPMKRVIAPLQSIGAKIYGRANNTLAPLSIIGTDKLNGFAYESPIASAQVKSAMILAALRADRISTYQEPEKSRDHSERMLLGMGAKIIATQKDAAHCLQIEPLQSPLAPLEIEIPSDPSSAFFFAVAASIVPHSEILLKNVLLNPTRIEAYEVLKRMGAKIEYHITSETYECIGDIYVQHAPLQAVEVSEAISWLIDEIPALSIAMACAKGKSSVKNAKELRVKECDRIKAVVQNLRACGIEAEESEDGFSLIGGEFKGGKIASFGDHRIAMSFALIGLLAPVMIEDSEVMAVSFPHFMEILKRFVQFE